jgi:23S rRNA (guanosine2251-2'-O)-methyltransferase
MPRENILYGYHSAEEIIKNQPRRINHIWTVSGHRTDRLKRLLDLAHEEKIPIRIVGKEALSRLAGTQHHQDIVLEVSPYRYHEAEELLENAGKDSMFCILDEIQDATNLGNLVRTMEGAGVDGIFLPERRSATVTAATHRLSAGALEHVKIARVKNLANLMEQMKERGIRVICADAAAEKLWCEADYSGPIAILVGNEQKGVRRLLRERSSESVRIPMLGKLQSLNVAAAAAVLLYEAIRQKSKIHVKANQA